MSISRREALKLGMFGATACTAVAQEVARRVEAEPPRRFINQKQAKHAFRASPPARRPHIFLLTVDMVSPDHYHPSRSLHREMNLPTLRALRADGVEFTNAFCTSPLCAPARAALATGRYTYITANGERAHDGHETVLRPDDVIFQEYLKATGYVTKHAGKGHLGAQKFIDAFDENVSAWDRWDPPIRKDEGYQAYLRRLRVKPQRYRREIRLLQQDRKSPGNSMGGWIEQEDGSSFPMEAGYSHYLANTAISKLDSALAAAGGGPVYLQLDLFDPHQPFAVPDGFAQREEELRKVCSQLPVSYHAVRQNGWKPFVEQPRIYDLYRKYWGLYEATALADYRVAHALQMEMVDAALGRVIAALKERKIYDDSIVILTSDHGEMNGRQAVVDKGVYLYPDVLRVPLIVKFPGARPKSVDTPVCHLDLAPTLLSVAGIEPEERLDGRSLLPAITGDAALPERDFLFECGWHVGVNFACGLQRRLADGRHYLYSYNLSSEVDELYDLASGDAETLASRPLARKARSEMIERLGAFLAADPRWLGYWASFRVDKYFDLPGAGGDMQLRQK